MYYSQISKEQLNDECRALRAQYDELVKKELKLDMSRGKPDTEQVSLSDGILETLRSGGDCISENGTDCRNYGVLDGLPEAKKLFSDILDIPPENILVGGCSSLSLMYDEVVRAMLFGVTGGKLPWSAQGKIKFLCPVPGYDRHFAICEHMGIEMINIPMGKDGPDMDMIERYVSEDESVKGIWCVPKYSNPEGTVYSDETVRRFAALKPKADDFRIFWDNAYAVHDLYGEIKLANLFTLAHEYANDDLPIIFTSTSKISYAGAGLAAMAASKANIDKTKKSLAIQTIGYDKLNQLRHVKYFKNAAGVNEHMKKHAALLRPKFEAVIRAFRDELGPLGVASWSEPRGGYFISLNVVPGCAKRVYELARGAGVTLTTVGATFPYGIDPLDSNLRIAPSYPPVSELKEAVHVLCLCVRLAAAERALSEK